MAEPVISVQSLEKSYGSVRAVDGISFEVVDGGDQVRRLSAGQPLVNEVARHLLV